MGAVTVFRLFGSHQGKHPGNEDEYNEYNRLSGCPSFTEKKIGIQS
jgi:hypothetical protein